MVHLVPWDHLSGERSLEMLVALLTILRWREGSASRGSTRGEGQPATWPLPWEVGDERRASDTFGSLTTCCDPGKGDAVASSGILSLHTPTSLLLCSVLVGNQQLLISLKDCHET